MDNMLTPCHSQDFGTEFGLSSGSSSSVIDYPKTLNSSWSIEKGFKDMQTNAQVQLEILTQIANVLNAKKMKIAPGGVRSIDIESPSGLIDLCDEDNLKQLERFNSDLENKKQRWANVTNNSIVAELDSEKLYTEAAAKCFPALHNMTRRLQNHGMETTFQEKEGKEFDLILCAIFSRDRSRTRSCWLNFLHQVCDEHFNEVEPQDTGMRIFFGRSCRDCY